MTLASARPFTLLAVTGLRAEARIAAGPGIVAISGGGDGARLEALLHDAAITGLYAVVSFGIAGGLSRDLKPGDVIVADAIAEAGSLWPTDARWRARLAAALPSAFRGTIAGSDQAVSSIADKAALQHRHDALAVDMESHIAARFAALRGVPFAAVRVIADAGDRCLPHAALVGMRPDGSTDSLAVLRALARRPGDVPALVRVALDAKRAFASLKQVRKALDASFSEPDRVDAGPLAPVETASA